MLCSSMTRWNAPEQESSYLGTGFNIVLDRTLIQAAREDVLAILRPSQTGHLLAAQGEASGTDLAHAAARTSL